MNNREAASFILLGAAFVGVLCLRAVRPTLAVVARQLLWSKLGACHARGGPVHH